MVLVRATAFCYEEWQKSRSQARQQFRTPGTASRSSTHIWSEKRKSCGCIPGGVQWLVWSHGVSEPNRFSRQWASLPVYPPGRASFTRSVQLPVGFWVSANLSACKSGPAL